MIFFSKDCAGWGWKKASENLPIPKHSEEIGHIDEFYVSGRSRYRIEGDQNQPAIRMLILKCLKSSFVPSLHFLAGFDFDGHLGIAYDGIHLLMVVSVPVGNVKTVEREGMPLRREMRDCDGRTCERDRSGLERPALITIN